MNMDVSVHTKFVFVLLLLLHRFHSSQIKTEIGVVSSPRLVYSQFLNKRRATIIFCLTLTAHIWLNRGRRDVIEPPKYTKFCHKQGSSRLLNVNTLDRDVKINRGTTFIRKVRVSA